MDKQREDFIIDELWVKYALNLDIQKRNGKFFWSTTTAYADSEDNDFSDEDMDGIAYISRLEAIEAAYEATKDMF